jgi:hypothetical protein
LINNGLLVDNHFLDALVAAWLPGTEGQGVAEVESRCFPLNGGIDFLLKYSVLRERKSLPRGRLFW